MNLDLTSALNFIERKGDSSYRIGIVDSDEVDLIFYKKGDVVVFRDSSPNEKTFLQIHHRGTSRRLTIESPYSPELIEAHDSNNIPIFSYNIVSGVPPKCIREIENLDDL